MSKLYIRQAEQEITKMYLVVAKIDDTHNEYIGITPDPTKAYDLTQSYWEEDKFHIKMKDRKGYDDVYYIPISVLE